MSRLERAIEIATEAHKGQVDKSGKEYIGHPFRVMEMGKTEEEKIVGMLHDVVEDTDWTFERLAEEGFSDEVIAALKCVTAARQEHPNAYDPWNEEADAELARMWAEGMSVAEIADHFGRKSSAIISRLKKLGL